MADMFDAFSRIFEFIGDTFSSAVKLFKLAFDAYGYIVATVAVMPLYVQTCIMAVVGVSILLLVLSIVKGVL